MAQVLIVEDEATSQFILEKAFQKWGHRTHLAATIKDAENILSERKDIELILLDRVLPDGDGIRLCRRIKKNPETRLIPVIILSSLSQLKHELGAYKNGADLNLTKPADLVRLKSYTKAVLHRLPYRGERPYLVQCGPLVLKPSEGTFQIGKDSMRLPSNLFKLLYLLGCRQGKAVSRTALIRKLWKNSVKDKEVDVAVSRLRKHLGPKFSGIIQTVAGKGYAINLNFKIS